ncbi:hypothetical protein [Micromonospora avicenniae]|uniref:hypothetical protein n=1 Tax=Micromonospora avicenniae TaxID=1198245 RepID=UPI0033211145
MLRRRAGEPAAIAAARYAEHLVDTEARVARLTGKTEAADRLDRTRDLLSGTCQAAALAAEEAYQADLVATEPPSVVPDGLATRVLREVASDVFDQVLGQLLRRRGLPPHALDRPAGDLWGWLSGHETPGQETLHASVRRLREMEAAAFVRTALDDLNGRQTNAGLSHPGLVERWTACAGEIMAALTEVRDSAETQLRQAPPRRQADLATRLRQAGEAYARGSARCLEARLIVGGFHVQVARLLGEDSIRRLRAQCLDEAMTSLDSTNPVLIRLVVEACREHEAGCPEAAASHPCGACAAAVAEAVRQRRTGALGPRVREQQPTSGEERSRPPKPAIEQRADGNLVCPAVLKQIPAGKRRNVVVVETFSRHDGWFGYGWIRQSGRKGQGTGRAVNGLDEAVQALCRAALQRGHPAADLHLVTRHARAANVVQLTLLAGQVFTPMDTSLSDDTRSLLTKLLSLQQKVSVSLETCRRRHGGSVEAEQLAQRSGQPEYVTEEQSRAAAPTVPSPATPTDDRSTGPDDEDGPARWLDADAAAQGEMSWRVALHRVHLDGKWCPLPDGRMRDDSPGRRIRLHLEHEARTGSSSPPVQRVALRRRDGRWELAGVQWPADLRPGTLVTVTMQRGKDYATASTTPLAQPTRIDGLEFTHRYDARVVTRENGPGADQYGRAPDLTDMSWVLHTLRKLGYLSEDGGAILAEDALLQNCLRLGLPPLRAKGIHRAVERLVADRTLHRVKGTIDPDDRPWYPPRQGGTQVSLLRYVPRVEAVAAPREATGEWHPHRQGHPVTGFLRRLPAGAQASPEQEEAYLEDLRNARIVGRGLPRGRTYVKPHYRKR